MPIHSIYIHPMWMCNAEWDGVEKDRPMMLDRFLRLGNKNINIPSSNNNISYKNNMMIGWY
jgi:hypothetical protein